MMREILAQHYPDFDWNTLEVLPVVFMPRTGNYRIIESRWPIDIYPTVPTSEQIENWVNPPDEP